MLIDSGADQAVFDDQLDGFGYLGLPQKLDQGQGGLLKAGSPAVSIITVLSANLCPGLAKQPSKNVRVGN